MFSFCNFSTISKAYDVLIKCSVDLASVLWNYFQVVVISEFLNAH